MPTVRANGIDLHYIERGSGAETIVFSHSFLVDHRHFEPQIEALAQRYRVIAYDHRDHGRSGRARAPYDIYDLMSDGARVIEHTNAAPCHWVGLSTGGFVGMRLALRRPELLRSLVLMDTSASAESVRTKLRYRALLQVFRFLGFGPVMGEVKRAMFSPTLLDDPTRAEELNLWESRMKANDRAALVRFGRAIWWRDDVLHALPQIDLPTLVVSGEHDRALPPVHAEAAAAAIPNAELTLIKDAGHLSTVEQPEAVNEVLSRFLD